MSLINGFRRPDSRPRHAGAPSPGALPESQPAATGSTQLTAPALPEARTADTRPVPAPAPVSVAPAEAPSSPPPTLVHRLAAEFVGTFWLVLGGCGSALLAANFGDKGIGLLGVSLAFGLTVLTMAYALGHISGGHFNPAVTLGLVLGRRFDAREVLPYVAAQVLGAVTAAAVLFVVASGRDGFTRADGFAANGFGSHSPGGYSLLAALVIELVLTAGFVTVILGVTDRRAPEGFGPLAIGLALTLVHLVSIPVTNTSVNPARSTSQALFQGDWALGQLWLFWLAPLVGAAIAGIAYRFLTGEDGAEPAHKTGSDPTP